ncbi:4a-hydroxytetrahydrobiopterin dehydratase [Cohnella cholangitidis]|uniref:4a-hydroxytetrahydrobiopterin dehydratase n=1 Tax=Cohnella cholangitidis TaxID=2598458 RepID=A0A7G5BZC8_9BACL|nr:4a-hydroxytetrahydrobiopterin dehydratase [Cohnella cholangitidis]QMV42312.1 4a-hydroxytetrahydrobiopterin dehydratase [Cohnella cholangitidis]
MGKHPLLTEQELEAGLLGLADWKVEDDGKWLARKRLFPSFMEAISFVNQIAAIAEERNHHPFIGIDYRRVTVRLTTWNSGGLTSLDIDSAKAYDRL